MGFIINIDIERTHEYKISGVAAMVTLGAGYIEIFHYIKRKIDQKISDIIKSKFEQTNEFKLILDNLKESIIIVSDDEIQYVNDQLLELLSPALIYNNIDVNDLKTSSPRK
jgi:hypothetical protein